MGIQEILKRLELISQVLRLKNAEIVKQQAFMDGTKEALSNVEVLSKDAKLHQFKKEIQEGMTNVVGGLMIAIGQPLPDESQLNFTIVKQVLDALKNQK